MYSTILFDAYLNPLALSILVNAFKYILNINKKQTWKRMTLRKVKLCRVRQTWESPYVSGTCRKQAPGTSVRHSQASPYSADFPVWCAWWCNGYPPLHNYSLCLQRVSWTMFLEGMRYLPSDICVSPCGKEKFWQRWKRRIIKSYFASFSQQNRNCSADI